MPQQPPTTARPGSRARRASYDEVSSAEVARVELLGLVELGVAEGGRVRVDLDDPAEPLAVLESGRDVGGVGAVDDEAVGRAPRPRRRATASRSGVPSGSRPSVSTVKPDQHRDAGPPGGAGDPDALLGRR